MWAADARFADICMIERKKSALRFNVQFKSWLNQLSLSHESNAKDERDKQKKTNEQLSPKMVIKMREIRGEGDYGGKDLRKR